MKTANLVLILAYLLIVPNAWAADTNPLLRGHAFSDPTQQVKMPDEWLKKTIQYKEWAKNADLAINFDQQTYPLILPAIQEYAKTHQIDIAVQEGTCGTAAKDLADKAVDIGIYCCPPGDNDRLPGLKFHTLGIEALPLLVHKDNPVKNLTFEQAQQIFQGKIFRWSEVEVSPGVFGSKSMIQPVGRLHCKQRPGHWRLLLDNEDMFSPRLFNVGTIADMISQVATNPHAIGMEELWMLEKHDRNGTVKTILLNSVAPNDIAKLAKGAYPLYNTIAISIWEEAHLQNPHALGLLKHLLAHMEEIDPKYGIVSAVKLQKAGWKFVDGELVGEPD